MKPHPLQIGFLGGGQMGRALATAMANADPTLELHVAERMRELREELARCPGVRAVASAEQLPDTLQVLILAIKPQDLATALDPLEAWLTQRQPLVISIAAGITTDQLRDLCGIAPIVRAMPNRPSDRGVGATALFAPVDTDAKHRALATRLLATAGLVEWVDDESLMDVVTALSGSGPAYFFLLAEAMVDAAVALGLPSDSARRLARATLQGSGAMCTGEVSLAALRESVTSKGGTTAAALAQFRADGFDALVAKAIQAAVTRGHELAGKPAKGA